MQVLAVFCIIADGRPKCGPNEEWSPLCGTGCELTCEDVEPVSRVNLI